MRRFLAAYGPSASHRRPHRQHPTVAAYREPSAARFATGRAVKGTPAPARRTASARISLPLSLTRPTYPTLIDDTRCCITVPARRPRDSGIVRVRRTRRARIRDREVESASIPPSIPRDAAEASRGRLDSVRPPTPPPPRPRAGSPYRPPTIAACHCRTRTGRGGWGRTMQSARRSRIPSHPSAILLCPRAAPDTGGPCRANAPTTIRGGRAKAETAAVRPGRRILAVTGPNALIESRYA